MDFNGHNCCGLTIEWTYEDGYVDILLVPGYVQKALAKSQHSLTMPHYSPHECYRPNDG